MKIDGNSLKGNTAWSSFWQGFSSDVLNPKVAIFYLSFLPQFVVGNEKQARQLLLLGVTANVVGITSSVIIVCFSATVTKRLRRDVRVSAWLRKALGGIFIALGIKLATEKVR